MEDNEVRIRPLRETDFRRLNEIRTSRGVFEYILSLDNETLLQTISYFTDEPFLKYTYIAEKPFDGQDVVAGYIRLCIDREIRRRHKGKISVAVANEFQCIGIGGKLFDFIINLAENWLMLKKLELTVMVKNIKAINMYKSKGFEIEGTLKADTVVNGQYEDVCLMSKLL
jgi:putative acetyltransferase